MEQGGEQSDEDNPFSFKAFLKRGTEDPAEKKKAKKPGTRKKKSQPATDTPTQGANPFSFKNFVAARSANDNDTSDVVKVKRPPGGLSDDSDNSDHDGDKNTGPMLSIVKTAKSAKLKHKRKEKLFTSSSDSSEFDSNSNTMPISLPGNRPKVLADKAIAPEISTPTVKQLMGDSAVLRTDKAAISNPPLVSIGTTALDNVGSDSSSSEHSDVVLVTGTKSVLPNIVHNDTADITSFAYDETLLVENNRLKKENESLKTENAALKENVKSEKKKCSELRAKIITLKKKESEETQALENMVANVEKNLVASTQRAAAAEATITELTKEIAILKGKLVAQDPEAIHQQHELVLNAVREKAAYATQNLYSAAEKADHSIRELMSGAETLKNIADILVYIDRVALTKSTS